MEKRKYRNNLLVAGFFIIFSVAMIGIAIPNEIAIASILGSSSSSIDSRFFPYLVSAMMGFFALIEFVASFIQYKITISVEDSSKTPSLIRILSVFTLFLLYAYLFGEFGFIISTAIVPPCVLFVMKSRKWVHYAIFYGVAIITYIVFVFVLKISI